MRRTRAGGAAAALVLVATLVSACDSAQHLVSEHPVHHARATGPTGPSTSPPPVDTPRHRLGGGPPGRGLARFYTQSVTWSPCGGEFTCARIWVPLDYAHPGGPAIRIAAKMRPAASQPARVGTLFINPGGPGGSGVDYVSQFPAGSTVAEAYDIVGFDPRGVGRSAPVECVSDHFLDEYSAADPTPDTPAEVRTMERLTHEFAAGCERESGPLLDHVSTIDAARDMDVMRAVVHDRTLNYYGASYGTFLGATYAALFPHKVGRMVLDGAVDPEQTNRQAELRQAAGFQSAFTAYLRSCVSGGNCPLGSTVAIAQRQVVQLLNRIDAHPLPTISGRPLTQGLAFLGIVTPLYNRVNWPLETAGLEQALEGNGDNLMYLADQYTGRKPNGHYSSNSAAAQAAISCLDHPSNVRVAQIRAQLPAFRRVSPIFGPPEAWGGYSCHDWPAKPTSPPPNYAAPGAPPIVVIGTTRDPATPYQEAVNLARELDSGVLLSRDGDGHTAYDSGNVCILSAVDTYLVTGTPPPVATMC